MCGTENPDDPLDVFITRGREQIQKTASSAGNGAHVYVPGDWEGEDVKVIRVTGKNTDTDTDTEDTDN